MRRLFLGLTAGALGIVGLAATPGIASAREFHGHGHSYHREYGHREYGHRFRGGCYYYRSDCPVWTRRVWNAGCCRWEYLDPCLNVWYYYYAPGGVYYPITYCP